MTTPTTNSLLDPAAAWPPTPDLRWRTVAELLDSLGGISPERVRLHPAPGQASELDLCQVNEREAALCELVDGTLVEKTVGFQAALLAGALLDILRAFVRPHRLGLVLPGDGPLRLRPGLVRLPDVSFISWQRIPGGRVPTESIPDLVADLAVEVLSASNTPAEMARKRTEYFSAGTRLVWIIDPDKRTVTVYTAPDTFVTLGEGDTLDGGDVLPGFSLPLKELFAELDQYAGEPPAAQP